MKILLNNLGLQVEQNVEEALGIIVSFIMVMFNIMMTIVVGRLGCMQCISSMGGQPMQQLPDTQMRQSTLPGILVHWLQFQYTARHPSTVPGTPVQCHARQFHASRCCMRENQNIKALHFSTVLYTKVLYCICICIVFILYMYGAYYGTSFRICVFILYLYRIVGGSSPVLVPQKYAI